MTKLVVIRHGNTFEAEETPRRVGAKTDIPLTDAGLHQAEKLGMMLKKRGLAPVQVFSSPLRRTMQSAHVASEAAGTPCFPQVEEFLREIDYGVDENQVEEKVIARLGEDALKKWEEEAILPSGWNLDIGTVIDGWKDLAAFVRAEHEGEVVWAVTSNGIARFAPHITGDFTRFASEHGLKLKTGACGILECNEHGMWRVLEWNLRG